MSRSETARASAAAQSEQPRSVVRTESEHQRELSQLLEQIAQDVTTLSQEHRAVIEELQATIRSSSEQLSQASETASSTITDDLKKAQGGAARTRTELRKAIEAVQPTVGRIEASASRLRLTSILLAVASGMLLGATCIVALAIWQPDLLTAAWRAAEALGTLPQ